MLSSLKSWLGSQNECQRQNVLHFSLFVCKCVIGYFCQRRHGKAVDISRSFDCWQKNFTTFSQPSTHPIMTLVEVAHQALKHSMPKLLLHSIFKTENWTCEECNVYKLKENNKPANFLLILTILETQCNWSSITHEENLYLLQGDQDVLS